MVDYIKNESLKKAIELHVKKKGIELMLQTFNTMILKYDQGEAEKIDSYFEKLLPKILREEVLSMNDFLEFEVDPEHAFQLFKTSYEEMRFRISNYEMKEGVDPLQVVTDMKLIDIKISIYKALGFPQIEERSDLEHFINLILYFLKIDTVYKDRLDEVISVQQKLVKSFEPTGKIEKEFDESPMEKLISEL